MAWWDQYNDMLSSDYDDQDDEFDYFDDDDYDYDSDDSGELQFRDREKLADIGHDLYRNLVDSSSNKKDKETIRKQNTGTEGNGQMFCDKEFPANSTSLIKDWGLAEFSIQRKWKNFTWKRASEIFPQPIKVFDNIDPNDINQGLLGDCYFLSSLSSIAEFPERIERLFDTKEYQPSGCYTVEMLTLGVKTEYVIDDFFPCNGSQVAFSGPKVERGVSELWVLLLEKAWAKRFGSYFAIEAGFTKDVLTDLTGGPCEEIQTDQEDFWDRIYDADKNDWILTAASAGDDGCGDMVSEMGLVTLHAYAIIKVEQVNGVNGQARVLKIRNPWGEQEWTGDWSDDSELWTVASKKIMGWKDENDGTFCMGVEDFSQYFTSVTICRVHDRYFSQGVQFNQEGENYNFFSVNFAREGHGYISIVQVDSRNFDEELQYDYSPVRLIIAKKVGKDLVYVAGKAGAYERDIWLEFKFTKGEYIVLADANWLSDWTDQLGLSVYSSVQCEISNVTFAYQDSYLQKVYTLDAIQNKDEVNKEQLAPGIFYYDCTFSGSNSKGVFMEGFFVDIIENTTSNKIIQLEIMHKSFANMLLCPPYSGSTYKVNVNPGCCESIVKKQVSLLETTDYSMGRRMRVIDA